MFGLSGVALVMDGTPWLVRNAPGDEWANMIDTNRYSILGGASAGAHALDVYASYRSRSWGVYSYVRAYCFKLRARHRFSVTAGQGLTVRAVGHEKGSIVTPFEERPAIGFSRKPLAAAHESAPTSSARRTRFPKGGNASR